MRMEGYFDESGSFEEAPHIFCLAGYIIGADAAKVIDAKWEAVLKEHDIPYFHMVDCAHGTGIFANMDKAERIVIETKLIELIKAHTLEGWAIVAKRDNFKLSIEQPDPYSALVKICVIALQSFMHGQRIEGDMAYFFEAGHKNKGDAYNHVAKMISELPASITFAEKADLRLLQAADILAWQVAKFAKDDLSKKRPRRKDFASLLEHKHTILYLENQDSMDIMRTEVWPPNRRKSNSGAMFFGSEGTSVVFSDGTRLPVVYIDQTKGVPEGIEDLVFVSFKSYDKKDYNFGFDGVRLAEAVSVLLDVTKNFPESVISEATIDVESMFLLFRKDDILFRMQMKNGRHISFRVPEAKRQAIMQAYGVDPTKLAAALERGQIQILQVF